jgi:hypothetical protein
VAGLVLLAGGLAAGIWFYPTRSTSASAGHEKAAAAAPATRYVVPNGSDSSNSCTNAGRPCRTFNHAYQQARPGDVIEIGGGTYPRQTIRSSPNKLHATQNVLFRPAPGAIVNVNGTLTMYGSHAVFQGGKNPYTFRIKYLNNWVDRMRTRSNHVTYENLDGRNFSIGPAAYITIRGGDWGPANTAKGDDENVITPDGNHIRDEPSHIVLDGLLIHHQQSSNLRRHHQGGLMLVGGGSITIRNTTFVKNVVYDIEVGGFNGAKNPHHVTLENNVFGAPVTGLGQGAVRNDGQAEVQLQPGDRTYAGKRNGYHDWLVRYNSFRNGFAPRFDGPAAFYRNFRVLANTGDAQTCQRGIVYRYNAWSDGRCGTTDRRIGRLPYTSSSLGSENFHLRSGTRAQNIVPRSAAKPGSGLGLAHDIDGGLRPCGTGYDAGSDERC